MHTIYWSLHQEASAIHHNGSKTDQFFFYRTRPGERVAKRRRCKSSIGINHKINENETIKWFKNRFDGIVR